MTGYPVGNVNGQLWYPRNAGADPTISVALYDVRAANDLEIGYDFERDGWVIRMDRTHDDGSGIIETVEESVEVAFIPAWLEASPGKETES